MLAYVYSWWVDDRPAGRLGFPARDWCLLVILFELTGEGVVR